MNLHLKETIASLLNETGNAGVKLIAVTKTVPVDIINEAISCGITAIGENRVQELLSKYDGLNKNNLEIHLIGTLQTNKVKYIIDKVDLIHSVDSIKLAEEIDRRAGRINKIQDVLIEVNQSGEKSKGGIAVSQLDELIIQMSKLRNIRVRGLMCIPPIEVISGDNAVYFDALHKMLVDINGKKIDNIYMDILSMGMSADYNTAITYGSTMVRVGTKIFGTRKNTEVQL